MIVYEKNNKLNINFENELDNPDIEIGKGEINVNGNNIVSGGGAFFAGVTSEGGVTTLDKTWKEIHDAIASHIPVYMTGYDGFDGKTFCWPVLGVRSYDGYYSVEFPDDPGTGGGPFGVTYFGTDSENGYPEHISE